MLADMGYKRVTMGRSLLFHIILMAASTAGGVALTYSETEAQQEVQWAGASYCCGTLGHGCDDWSCPSCQGSMETVVVSNSTTQANGFVGYTSDLNRIVVAFAGTDPLVIKNWIDDIDTVKIPFKGYSPGAPVNCSACSVHRGFYRTYMSVQTQVAGAVAQFRERYPNASLIVTGHSLGAAIAQHAALDLQGGGESIQFLYNFGQPRTGNEEFSAYSTGLLGGRTFRITHHKDPVPQLPFQWMGFHHEPLEIFYNELNTAFKICDGSGEDPKCSDQYYLDVNVADHLTYMGFDFTANYLVCKL